VQSVRSMAIAGVAFIAQPALAQDETQADQVQQVEREIVVTGAYTLDERIDTATGLGLTIRETPQSVSVITSQRILDQNLISVADVINNSVGVTVNEVDDVRNSFYARGFEIRNTQIDGVPTAWALAGANGETNIDVSIYERVEVVRGATGLLSGAGDPSASVNLVRKHADRLEVGGYLSASGGSWNTWRVSGDVGGAVTASGNVRARAVGRYEAGDSYIDLFKNEKFVLYGVVEADLTPDTLLRAGISHQESTPDAPAWGALPTFYTDGTLIRWPRSRSTSADWSYWNTTNQNIFATLAHEFGGGWSMTGNYNRLRNTQSTELLYMSGMVDRAAGTVQFSYPFKASGDSVQDSFDGQIKGEVNALGRKHDLVVGALHSVLKREDDTFAAPAEAFLMDVPFVDWTGHSFPRPAFSTTPFRATEERIEQTGYYAAVRLNLADQLKLIGGGRLASWKQTGFSYGVGSNYGDDGKFIPYVGLLFDVAPNHRLYASYTTIFQPQNYRDRSLQLIAPLEGKAYEIGLKSAFLNEALQTSVALFRISQDNVAQPDIMVTPPGGGLPQQTYIAAQGTTSEGFEIEVTGRLLPGWNINFGYSQFTAEDRDGRAVNTDQSRRLLKLFTTYDVVGSGLTIGGGVNYRSKFYSDELNPATGGPFRLQQNGFVLVNLMARYKISEAIEFQANIENLLDKTYYSQAGFFSQYRYGAPRNFTATATYRF